MKQIFAMLGLVLGMSMFAGCASKRVSDLNAEGPQGVFRPYNEREVSAVDYRVAPPDKLTISSPGNKELDNVTTTIRPDGKISLTLLGEFYVAGKTPQEIAEMILAVAVKYYNNPEIKVVVAEYQSKHYMVVSTNVREQGKKPYTGRDTVLSALAQAGFSNDSWPQQVALSRPERPGQPRSTAIIDFKQMAMTGDLRQNYLIEENDIIYVPNGPLTDFRITSQNLFSPISGGVGAVSGVQGVGRPGGGN